MKKLDIINTKLFTLNDFYLPWSQFMIVVLLVMGIFFRFVNIDKKIYWYDENYTFLRISGYTENEILQEAFNGSLIKVEDIKKFQQVTPEKNLINTINSLALEDVQHPPLYYIIARFAMQLFNNSIAATRNLSSIISLFALPCIYWLCLELFEFPLIGGLAIALISISPFHLAFAQEAREYSLWTVTTILSSASLLRAMRLKNKLNWSIYALTMTLSYYTLLLSFFVAISHGIYVLVIEKFRLSKNLKFYIFSSLASVLAFTPWIWIFVNRIPTFFHTINWMKEPIPLTKLMASWMRNLSYVFFDIQYEYDKLEILNPIFLILAVYAIYYVCRYTQKKTWLFIILLVGVTSLSMILPDLIFGGQRSTNCKYFMPCYLGIELAVAYLFGTKIISISIPVKFQNLWRIIIIVLITLGVLSCTVSSRAQIWWNKSRNEDTLSVAEVVNQARRPIIISDGEVGDLLSLSYLLESNVYLKVQSSCYTSCSKDSPQTDTTKLTNIPNEFTDVFLYKPSEFVRSKLSINYNIKHIPHKSNTVWELQKR